MSQPLAAARLLPSTRKGSQSPSPHPGAYRGASESPGDCAAPGAKTQSRAYLLVVVHEQSVSFTFIFRHLTRNPFYVHRDSVRPWMLLVEKESQE